MKVDSYRFLPRSFRPLYEGRGPFPGEQTPVWTPFEKRLSESRIALLSSAGFYLRESQPPFDLDREQTHPHWGDPSWRSIPASSRPDELRVAHLHINDEDLLTDPEIALPAKLLQQLEGEGVIGGAVDEHLSVMGYQDRSLEGWKDTTVHELVAHLRDQNVGGLVLAPA